MEFENTVNDVQEGVVDLPNETPEYAASEAEEQGAAPPEQEPEQERGEEQAERPIQTPEENAAFAAMRRENERLAREMQERDALFQTFFPGEEDPLAAAQMQAYGLTPEQIAAQRAAAEEQQRMAAELEELRAFRAQSTFERDLNAIKTAYPDVQAKTVEELGGEFAKIMAAGGLDAVTAYEIVRAKEEKSRKTAPPEVGKVNAASKSEKAYYTQEEVKSMSQEEVSKNWEKVMASRAKWK